RLARASRDRHGGVRAQGAARSRSCMGVAPSWGDPGARYRASRKLPCNRHSRRREARPPRYTYKSVAGRARNAPATHPRAVAIRLPATKPPCTRVTVVGVPHGPPRTGSTRRHVAERSRRLPPAIATFIVRAASDHCRVPAELRAGWPSGRPTTPERRIMRLPRYLPAFSLVVLCTACGAADRSASDGAGSAVAAAIDTVGGIERLTYPGTGGPRLAWSFDTVAIIGEAFGTEEYQFDRVTAAGLAGDADGNVYVLDLAGSRVLKYGPDGRYLGS